MLRATLSRCLGLSFLGVIGLLTVSADAVTLSTTADLGGPDRYLAHLSTDKPIYREGEKVYARAVMLHARSHKPMEANFMATVELKGPKGDTLASGNAQATDSVIGFEWQVPGGAAGGEYLVKMTFPWDGFPPAERKFEVRAYRPPRLKSQILFLRDGYGPGDTVTANLHSERAEGGIPNKAKVTVVARVDGAEVYRGGTHIDQSGNCSASFPLPKNLSRGEGTLAFIIEDGGVVETASKTIPILLQTMDLSMYPEGGDLVVGLPARVYVEARTPAKKPADLTAAIVDDKGTEIARFATEHEGRGRFVFTPVVDRRYTLKIVKPSGIDKTFPLPAVKEAGVVLSAVDDVTPANDVVKLRVGMVKPGEVTLTLSQREAEIAATKIIFGKKGLFGRRDLAGTMVERSLKVPKGIDGVLIATVWGKDGVPLAERLIFRQPAERLKVAIAANKKEYVTGDTVELTIKTTDHRDHPVRAAVGLTVTDESVLEMIETREQAPRLPVMVLLEDDVRELADAHVYLDEKNDKAPRATDLLLGTQGWRRFAMVDTPTFIASYGDAARRVLALRMPSIREREKSLGRSAKSERPMRSDRVPMAAAPPPMAPPAPRSEKMNKLVPAPAEAAPRADVLRQAMAKADMAADQGGLLGLREEEKSWAPGAGGMVWVREYAHELRPGRKQGDRVDFSETLFWSAATMTDETGKAKVTFALSDAVTSFRVLADGFDKNGGLGTATATVSGIEPFHVEPKVPLQVTTGDVIELPVAMVNATSNGLAAGSLFLDPVKGIAISGNKKGLSLAANSRGRYLLRLEVGNDAIGKSDLVVHGAAGTFADKVTHKLDVQPLGFPVEIAEGGLLAPNRTHTFNIEVPQEVVKGSVQTDISVFPTPLANMTQALERLMQEPNGCFEQTSSTNYPLVMAQQYFTTHTGVDPAIIERSQNLLKKGYDRLIGFQCAKKGYEWFGEDPGHEALSAYGLMEFTDMAKVMSVDAVMLKNTRAWLLEQRDGKGGFNSKRRALHTWLVEPDLQNGYITWALMESGERDSLKKEIQNFKSAAANSSNSYVTALGANVAALDGDKSSSTKLMQKLVTKQTKDGLVDGAEMSIVGSRGEALQIETTALATLAWLRDPAFAGNVEKSIRWLSESCKGGRYGSTQSTVLALRAIVEYDKARAKPKAAGSVEVSVDGKAIGKAVQFDSDTKGAITLASIADGLTPGAHRIELKMRDGAQMPFALAVRYNTLQPLSSDETRVYLKTSLKDRRLAEGQVTEVDVEVQNIANETIPTPVAIIGIPGGLEVRHDQLKELKKAGRIAAYEVIGRDVVLYWRELAAKKQVKLPISVVAAIPGTYTGPASRAYEYYADEYKQWTAGMKVEITAR
ncbi:MAG: A-macroglobulin complement component [Deltaproteobacteria bacterium RIFOXYA12_FULL_58_15]|nr:MAG: A-macroglobulin complement component [Deltaproteobacteria bacterium RIFOXYA12_FULL_58_15]OGR07646.1 MAG: A-macroglobulin complement component [Deltaproteobacteria bacterium RIFOXYB12_FULL_58_9]